MTFGFWLEKHLITYSIVHGFRMVISADYVSLKEVLIKLLFSLKTI